MQAALAIISRCDTFSITESDKTMIISVFGTIIKDLQEKGFPITTEIYAQYAILKVSTWSDGYFCIVARQMCSALYPIVNLFAKVYDD